MSTARELVARAMEKAQGAQASVAESESASVSFESGRLKGVRSAQSTAVSLRVVVDGRIGTASATDRADISGTVARALEAAQFGSPVHFSFPAPGPLPEVKLHDRRVVAVTKEEMIGIGEAMVKRIKAYNDEILVEGGISRSSGRSETANSAGIDYTREGTSFSVGMHGQLVRGTDILWAGDGLSRRCRDIDGDELADRTIEQFRMAERNVAIESGTMPVIFTPAGMNVLLLALRMGVNGKNVVLGSSPLAGKIGETIADESFSLTDDPLVDWASGSGPYDGEGVPHRRTPLVEKGVLKNFLYDLDTAGRAGVASTGNGIGCGPTNLVVAEGTIPYSEMIAGTEEGLLVHNVIGLGQGNPISGEFSVNLNLAYRIEKGRVVGRVKNTMLAGNTYEALKGIAAVGDRAEWVGGSLLTPHVKIASLSVTSR